MREKQERRFGLYFFIWLVALTFLCVFLVTRDSDIPEVRAQAPMAELIYTGTLTQTTAYMSGNLYQHDSRYVAYRFGWNDTATTTITFTLWLVDPVGNEWCTMSITSGINMTPEAYTLGYYTIPVTCPLWAMANGTIENITGTITPSIDIYLHGQ